MSCLARIGLCLTIAMFFLPAQVHSQDQTQESVQRYEIQDVTKVLVVKEKDGNREYSLDVERIDLIIDALKPHALKYPTRFANEQDKEAARKNAVQLGRVLKAMTKSDDAETKLLYQSALVHNMAHNLGLRGAMEEADRCYEIVLEREPDDARVQYLFGVFLASSNRTRAAIRHLQKASELEYAPAAYSLGLAYAVAGEKDMALEYLNEYAKRNPENEDVKRMIEAVVAGKIKRNLEPLGGKKNSSGK